MIFISCLALLTPLMTPLAAQAIEDDGPHLVGWQDLQIQDTFSSQGLVKVRIYYPAISAGEDTLADATAGPYPLVNFMHGWLGSADGYDDLCTHLASWGFVIVSTDTQRGLFPDVPSYARDSRALLHWAEGEAQDPQSWLSGMVEAGAPWGAAGHSMGGGTLPLLIGIESRVEVIVGLQAAANDAGNQAVMDYRGRGYWVAGSVDSVVPPRTVHDWPERAQNSERNIYFKVMGMGHSGCVDNPPNNEPLAGSEQARLHRRLVAGIFRAEMRGEEGLYQEFVGSGMDTEPVEMESRCYRPAIWASWDAGNQAVQVGGTGRLHGILDLGWSFHTAAQMTPFGLLGIDLGTSTPVYHQRLSSSGADEVALPVAPGWFGQTLYFTGLASGQGAASRLGNVAAVAVP